MVLGHKMENCNCLHCENKKHEKLIEHMEQAKKDMKKLASNDNKRK